MPERVMSNRRSQPKTPSGAASEHRAWWTWLDAAPAAFLAVVISAYAVLATYPTLPTRAPVPGVTAADPLALPFLALTVTAGIIRYFYARTVDLQSQADSRTVPSSRRDSS